MNTIEKQIDKKDNEGITVDSSNNDVRSLLLHIDSIRKRYQNIGNRYPINSNEETSLFICNTLTEKQKNNLKAVRNYGVFPDGIWYKRDWDPAILDDLHTISKYVRSFLHEEHLIAYDRFVMNTIKNHVDDAFKKFFQIAMNGNIRSCHGGIFMDICARLERVKYHINGVCKLEMKTQTFMKVGSRTFIKKRSQKGNVVTEFTGVK